MFTQVYGWERPKWFPGAAGLSVRERVGVLELSAFAKFEVAGGGEAVHDGDEPVGLVSSGGYGYTTGSGYAFAWVHPAHARPGTRLEVLILGDRRRARVLAEPAHDPKNERLKM